MPAVEEWSVSVYAEESHHWLAQKLESAPEWLYLQCATDKQKKTDRIAHLVFQSAAAQAKWWVYEGNWRWRKVTGRMLS